MALSQRRFAFNLPPYINSLSWRPRLHLDDNLVDFAGEGVVAFFVVRRYKSRIVNTDSSRLIERKPIGVLD